MEVIPSIGSNTAITKWAKTLLRTVGAVNATLTLLGAWFWMDSVRCLLTRHYMEQCVPEQYIPYFLPALVVMILINLLFLVILSVTAVRFIQVKISTVNSYSAAVLGIVVYYFAIHTLWRTGHGIGMSVAAATGIGNLGIGPFVFCFLVAFLYPVASIVLLQVIRWRYGTKQTLVSA
jgi:uncharacterized membrane protein